jgi:hypothetical protein
MGAMKRTGSRVGRSAAAGAGPAVAAGAVIMLISLVAAPGPWLQGYVSEAGAAGQPFAGPYRWGLVLLALGVALLGLALRLLPASAHRSFPPASVQLAGGLLGVAAVLAGTSAVVPCSNLCPLPPFEPTTVADVVHTSASIVGMVLLAGAMLLTALSGPGTAVRRLAAGAVSLTVPLGGALGLTMLFAGRGMLGAVLERLLLIVAVGWLIGTSVLAVVRNSLRVE